MQGNPDSDRGMRAAMRRAIFDTDLSDGEDFPHGADDPLTP
jgi:hypothetical protein